MLSFLLCQHMKGEKKLNAKCSGSAHHDIWTSVTLTQSCKAIQYIHTHICNVQNICIHCFPTIWANIWSWNTLETIRHAGLVKNHVLSIPSVHVANHSPTKNKTFCLFSLIQVKFSDCWVFWLAVYLECFSHKYVQVGLLHSSYIHIASTSCPWLDLFYNRKIELCRSTPPSRLNAMSFSISLSGPKKAKTNQMAKWPDSTTSETADCLKVT